MESEKPIPDALRGLYELDVDTDRILSTLAYPRRRFTLAYLGGWDAVAPLDGIASDISTWESRNDREKPSSQTVETVYIELRHKEAPALDDAGLVDFDLDADTLAITSTGEVVCSHLGLPEIDEDVR